jgi:hypothetical protein
LPDTRGIVRWTRRRVTSRKCDQRVTPVLSSTAMEALQNRIDSFSKAKRVKNPSKPSSSVSVKWVHPSSLPANPESLAEAGFYFSPTFDSRDSVTCYMCEKQLAGWQDEDDPFDLHWDRCGTTCCWASVRCGLRSDMDRHGR